MADPSVKIFTWLIDHFLFLIFVWFSDVQKHILLWTILPHLPFYHVSYLVTTLETSLCKHLNETWPWFCTQQYSWILLHTSYPAKYKIAVFFYAKIMFSTSRLQNRFVYSQRTQKFHIYSCTFYTCTYSFLVISTTNFPAFSQHA